MRWVTVRFLPLQKAVRVRPGTTIMQAARQAGVIIRSRCGGNASCLMCKVQAEPAESLSPVTSKERMKMGDLHERNIRLSCQTRCWAEVTVTIPEDPLKAAVRKRLAMEEENGE